MEVSVGFLTGEFEKEYREFLEKVPEAMFTHSLKYRDYLLNILDNAVPYYLVAFVDSEILAAIPMISSQSRGVTVINSLPFFGSHGGLLTKGKLSDQVRSMLAEACLNLYNNLNATSLVLIESPLSTNGLDGFVGGMYECDSRIGQISRLPNQAQPNIDQALLNSFHKKTRNMVRKGMKSGFRVGHGASEEILNSIFDLHFENITSLGGLPKPRQAFAALGEFFDYGDDYRIYYARWEGQIVSALLVFYFKNTVEYFVPATDPSFRELQPMSLLVYRAMLDAVTERKAHYWNWGGTWKSQEGVYRFKNRWGAKDFPYRYFCLNSFYELTREAKAMQLSREFPYFYLAPFS